jgi:hypothetical protein
VPQADAAVSLEIVHNYAASLTYGNIMERIKQKMAEARRQREAVQRRQNTAAEDREIHGTITLLSEFRRLFLPSGGGLPNYTVPVALIAAVLFVWWLGSGSDPDSRPTAGAGEERVNRPGAVAGLSAPDSAADLLETRIASLDERVDRLSESVTRLESRLAHAGAARHSTIDTQGDIAASPLPEEMRPPGANHSLAGFPAAAMETESQRASSSATNPHTIATGKPEPAAEIAAVSMADRTTADEPEATASDKAATTAPDAPGAAGPTPTARLPADLARKEPVADKQASAVTKTPGDSEGPDTPWVINLISSPNKTAAERFAAKAKSRDIATVMQQVTVKGTQYWRVQITGFSSREEAKVYARTALEKLGLKDVWITKR